jgi:predicted transcriptional regulator of viral defense system
MNVLPDDAELATLLSMDPALPPTFTSAQARAAGVHPRTLYRWRDTGEVMELSRGVFRRMDAPLPSYPDFLAVSARSSAAVICLLSAASHHELTDHIPMRVDLAVPRGTKPPSITWPPVQVHRFDPAHFQLGISRLEVADGEFALVTDPARTVVDLMRFRHRIGDPLALTALARYLRQPRASAGRLIEYARALNSLGPVRSATEVLLADV